jgi:DNA repair protein RadC
MSNPTPNVPMRRVAAVRVELVRERTITYPGGQLVSGPSDLAAVARAFIGKVDREVFVTIHVNSKHRINAIEVTAIGTLNATLVHPRESYRGAILACAAAVAFCHNHPSGLPDPSPEDIALTGQLLAAGEILGIRVLDHVVLGDPGYVSIRETSGLWADCPFHK